MTYHTMNGSSIFNQSLNNKMTPGPPGTSSYKALRLIVKYLQSPRKTLMLIRITMVTNIKLHSKAVIPEIYQGTFRFLILFY